MSEKLKPCPFCGGEGTVDRIYSLYYVFCKKCFAKTTTSPFKWEAIRWWNFRRFGLDSILQSIWWFFHQHFRKENSYD